MPRGSWLHRSSLPACFAAALVVGCLSVGTPEPGAPARVGAGEGLVFGRVRVFEQGQELAPWRRELAEVFLEDPVLRLALFQVESGRKRIDVPVSEEGRFEWILPAGTYLLYHTPSIEPPVNEPFAAFQVTGGADPVDLGEVRLSLRVERSLSAALATYALLDVEAGSGSAETAASFQRHHPGTERVRPGTLIVDPELGGLFESWSREACSRVLARHGVVIGRSEPR